MEFKSNLPYPEIKVECQNLENAKILQNVYTGSVSELTAIMSYSYQSFTQDEEVSHIISEISEVEMHHLSMLGNLIKLLGGDPVFKYTPCLNNTYYYWDTNLVNYEKNLKIVLLENIKSEEEAIKLYEECANIINDKNIKDILYRIIEDEKVHINIFNELLKK